jgi:hypothetical protein
MHKSIEQYLITSSCEAGVVLPLCVKNDFRWALTKGRTLTRSILTGQSQPPKKTEHMPESQLILSALCLFEPK